MHLKGDIKDTGDIHTEFFKDTKAIELDDSTFNSWKSELKKELPAFWESMTHFRRR